MKKNQANETPIACSSGRCPSGINHRKASESAGTRTQDQRIKSPLLYRLSYTLVGCDEGEPEGQTEKKQPGVTRFTPGFFPMCRVFSPFVKRSGQDSNLRKGLTPSPI